MTIFDERIYLELSILFALWFGFVSGSRLGNYELGLGYSIVYSNNFIVEFEFFVRNRARS